MYNCKPYDVIIHIYEKLYKHIVIISVNAVFMSLNVWYIKGGGVKPKEAEHRGMGFIPGNFH